MSEDARYESIALLERIATQDPSSPLYLPLAERMREQGRVEEAIRLCEERRGRPGECVGDRIVLGRCYLAAGRLTEARAQFESAVQLDRENVVALKALAGILSHQGNHGSASDFYRAVCRIDPGDLESQTALHQITSGEFPEVRPPDLVVAQGELTWQPVQPPREEEYLGEISLGLHTIESFDADAPKIYEANVQDFQEMALERFEVEPMIPPEAQAQVAAPEVEPMIPPEAQAQVAAPEVEPMTPPEAQAQVAAPEVEPADVAVAPDAPDALAPAAVAPDVLTPAAVAPDALAPAAVAPDALAPAAAPQGEPEPAPLLQRGSDWAELPRNPVPFAEPPKPPRTEQNKSAFEIWVRKLKGGPG